MTRPAAWFALLAVSLFPLLLGAEEAVTPNVPERARVGILGIQPGQDGAVLQVFPGGAAAAAGLQAGDRLVSVDGKPAATPESLREALKDAADRQVVIKLKRKGQEQETEVKATPKGHWQDSPEVQKDPLLGELRKVKDPAESTAIFRKFAAAHPGTDLGSAAASYVIHNEAKTGKMTLEALTEAVRAWVKALPVEHEFHGEMSAFWEDCKAVSGGKADLKAWLACLDGLTKAAKEDGVLAECRLAAALAAKDAGDEATALAYADALQKALPDSAAAKQAADMAYELRVLAKGKPAPDFHAPTLDGKGEVSLSALKGKPVLVDAWASWCGPCKAALPKLKAIYGEYSGKGLQVISLSLDEPKTKEKAVEEVAKQGLTWPQGWDKDAFASAYAKAYKVNAIPNYLLVDAKGCIVGHWVGFDEEGIRKALADVFPAVAPGNGKP